jgi:branched-chain amino acid aminotransferase
MADHTPTPQLRSWTLIDGEPADPGTPLVAANDRGVLSGDGVYTTMAVFGGVPFAISRHRRRLTDSLDYLGLEAAEVPWERVASLPTELGVADGRLRITVTAGPGAPLAPATNPTVFVTLSELDPGVPTPALSVANGVHPRDSRRFDAGHKTIAGAADTRGVLARARRHGANESLHPTSDHLLCEGTSTNVIVVTGGRVETPSLSTGCLPGITRQLLLDAGLVAEAERLTPHDATHADELILTSSVRGVIPVDSVDQRPKPGRNGPVWQLLDAYLTQLRAATPDPQAPPGP